MIGRGGSAAAALAILAGVWATGILAGRAGPAPAAAQGQPPCVLGGAAPTMDKPAPASVPVVNNNSNFDCMAWQAFISLNWPALAGQQGVADPSKPLGSPGPTVWQTFATVDQVFLANGARPALLATTGAAAAPRRFRVAGIVGPRHLRQKSKASSAFLKTKVPPKTLRARNMPKLRALAPASPKLDSDEQADGNVLIDQNGHFAYYEELLSPTEVDYIVGNGIYEAGAQNRFAAAQPISLPTGSTEVKAAWKILGPGDDPSHYITSQAYIDGGTVLTPVGLVGLHIMMRVPGLNQGVWATFSQIENAPRQGLAAAAHYAFNNPACSAKVCVPNQVTAPPTPTQVVQVFAPDTSAAAINAYVAGLVASHPAAGAMAYYQLLNVQWPTSSTPLPGAPQALPLPSGSPNTPTLINPVLETFMQTSSTSCLGCHAFAPTASPPSGQAGPFASGYSFLLLHAQPARAAGSAGKR